MSMGGHKQLLAIARALLEQPNILIFDKATSNLDSSTAEHFAATINQFKGKVSMQFITHTLPQNLLVDEVVRIRHGSLSALRDWHDDAASHVAEGGTHWEIQ